MTNKKAAGLVEKLFLLSFVISFLIGNVFKLSFFSPEIRISLLDISVIGFTFYIMLFHHRRLLTEIKNRSGVLRPAGIFLTIGFISILMSLLRFEPGQVVIGSLYLIRFTCYLFLIHSLPAGMDMIRIRNLKSLLILVTLITSGFQYILSPDIRHLQVSDWDPHYFRVVGSLLDPGFQSIILCFILFHIWFWPLFSSKNLNRLLWIITYLLFALTYSRSGFLAFIAGCGYLAFIDRSAKKIVYPAVLVLLTMILLPRNPGGEGVKLERTGSIQARIINWKNSATIFFNHPLTGVGFNNYRYAQKEYGFLDESDWLRSHAGAGADSSLLFIAATTGIAGLAAYIFLLSRVWKLADGQPHLKATFTAIAAHSVFLNSLFYPFVLFWLALSLSAARSNGYRQS